MNCYLVHLTKFDNKLAPLPGTQTRIEKEHDKSLEQYKVNLAKAKEELDHRIALKLNVKQQAVTLQTKVYFDTLFGQTINEAEKILNEKEDLLINGEGHAHDEMSWIFKFKKMMEEGRQHYVGSAIANGFQSIDYQDPETGNSFLHIVCRRGHLEAVEELVFKEFVEFGDTVNEEELSRAKDYLIGKTQLYMDKTEFVSSYFGQKLFVSI
jgi:predicted Zn-dependent peptidase